VCRPRVGARAQDGLGRRRSPGGIRREVGDDGWALSISLSGRGRSGAAATVGRLGRKAKQAAALGWAGAAGWAATAGLY
jgi:hypothetical protein